MCSASLYWCHLLGVVVGATVRSNANVMFRCAYHVVWSPKYRRKVLVGKVEERLKELRAEVVEEKQGRLVEVETMPDHVHLLAEVDRRFGIHRMV